MNEKLAQPLTSKVKWRILWPCLVLASILAFVRTNAHPDAPRPSATPQLFFPTGTPPTSVGDRSGNSALYQRPYANTQSPLRTPEGAYPARSALTPTTFIYLPLVQNHQVTPMAYTYHVVNTYPHDPGAFTQGLVFEDGFLYEGTGLWGQSSLRRVDLETGEILQSHNLSATFFGEGITIFDDEIIQLTWQSQTGFVYDRDTFETLRTFSYPTEGWGITHDDQWLIMSDGTSTLYFWDPETLEEIGRVQVRDPDGPVTRLNELEYVEGEVYANVWQTDHIARIDPQTGNVLGWIDLAGILDPSGTQHVDVLNGIAYDADGGRLFVTGKLWPQLFEIELVPLGDKLTPDVSGSRITRMDK